MDLRGGEQARLGGGGGSGGGDGKVAYRGRVIGVGAWAVGHGGMIGVDECEGDGGGGGGGPGGSDGGARVTYRRHLDHGI